MKRRNDRLLMRIRELEEQCQKLETALKDGKKIRNRQNQHWRKILNLVAIGIKTPEKIRKELEKQGVNLTNLAVCATLSRLFKRGLVERIERGQYEIKKGIKNGRERD